MANRWLRHLSPRAHEPPATRVVEWSIWLAVVGWMAAMLLAGVGSATAVAAGASEIGPVALLVGQLGLWAGFVGTAVIASRSYGSDDVRADFGLVGAVGFVKPVLIGAAVQLLVIPGIYLPLVAAGVNLDVSGPAESLFNDVSRLEKVVLAAGVVGVAPVAEELLFRGVLLGALGRHLRNGSAIWASALIFAATHFQLVQFPGLVAIGVTLAWLARRTGGVAAPIWAHVGFNATTVAALW